MTELILDSASQVESLGLIRSDQIGLSLPSPPRLGVWYGYCAHASDAEGFAQSHKSCQRTGLKQGTRDWSGWALRAHIVSDVGAMEM